MPRRSPPSGSARRPWPSRPGRALVAAVLIAALGILLGPSSGLASADEPTPRPVTLKGEIVDLACYFVHEGKGEGHSLCAKACVQGGSPVGLLADGRLFILFAPHEAAAPFEEAKKLAGQKAEVTGTIHDRNGVKGLAVTKVIGRP